MAAARRRDRSAGSLATMVGTAARRRDGSAVSPATMVGTAYRGRDRRNRSTATRVWIAAPIMWRRMKTILSPRRRRKVVKLQEVAKQAKPWGLRSRRMMQVSSLPLEIVATILSWLPVKSLMRFRCVCKEWRSLTYNPSFIKEHRTRSHAGRLALISTRYSSPKILLYDFGDNGEVRNQAFDARFGYLNGYNTVSNPVNGLICIKHCHPDRHGEVRYYLLNPVTRELAKLPTSGNVPRDRPNRIILWFDSSTGGYKLVELFYIEGGVDYCGCNVLELGTQAWREVGRAPCEVPACEPVLLNGAIHWISCRINAGSINVYKQSVVTFNLKDEKFQTIPFPTQITLANLAEWEGMLCIVELPLWYPIPGGGSLVRIWSLENHATCRWREAHCSQLPDYESIVGQLSLVGISGHQMLLVLCPDEGLRSICRYDLRTSTLRELYNEHPCGLHFPVFPSGLQFLTESLVSPRFLAGNLVYISYCLLMLMFV